MQVEQIEISNFLSQHPPFDQLPEDAVNHLAQHIEVAYYRSGTSILNYGDPIHDLYVMRSGAVETYRRTGELYNRLDSGDVFGQMGLMMNQRARFPVKTIEDTLVYCIPYTLFKEYCDHYEIFADYFETEEQSLLNKAVAKQKQSNDLGSVRINTLLSRDLVTISSNASIQDVALTMTDRRVSSLLITRPSNQLDAQADSLVGIITDRDLRKRVLAVSLPLETPVENVMSTELVTLDEHAYVFEAMLIMLRYNVHHLPVMSKQKPIGVISLSDILRYESQSSLLLVRSIFTQTTVDELALVAKELPAVFVRMVKEDANSHMIGSAMSLIGRSFKQRLLALAEEKLGAAPIPYCFIALGSMARDEQSIYSDQDNALILDEAYDESQHGEYFEQLAKFVCDGLAACGYRYCDGDIMATNPAWRTTLSDWKNQFKQWINDPNPQALLNSSIFFDLDGVAGETRWADNLRQHIAKTSCDNRRFLACIARNALNRRPPLGFFKEFVLEKDGEHKNSINLKRRGTAPLSDVIRVHALAIGSTAINTFERIDDIKAADLLPKDKARELSDAMEYISIVRIRHQAMQIEAGLAADNNVQPDQLPTFERRNLKEAFQVLSAAQNFLKFRYNNHAAVK